MQVTLDDYQWAAGVATDLVNTAPGVWNGIDQLPDAAALERFLADHGIAPRDTVGTGRGPTAGDVEPVHAVRTRLREIVDSPDPEDLVARAEDLSAATGGLTLVPGDGGRTLWQVSTRPDSTLAEQLALVGAVGVLGVVRALGVDRFRSCAAPTCSGAFIDTTRPGRRRYCMPGHCGNRVNVANHRARARRGTA